MEICNTGCEEYCSFSLVDPLHPFILAKQKECTVSELSLVAAAI